MTFWIVFQCRVGVKDHISSVSLLTCDLREVAIGLVPFHRFHSSCFTILLLIILQDTFNSRSLFPLSLVQGPVLLCVLESVLKGSFLILLRIEFEDATDGTAEFFLCIFEFPFFLLLVVLTFEFGLFFLLVV